MNKELKDYTVIELKALGFDQIAQIQQCEFNLKTINTELKNRNQPEVQEVVDKKEETVEEK